MDWFVFWYGLAGTTLILVGVLMIRKTRLWVKPFGILAISIGYIPLAFAVLVVGGMVVDRIDRSDEPRHVELVNQTDLMIFAREDAHACDQAPSAYFDPSIQLGDPRLRFTVSPGESEEVFIESRRDRVNANRCYRFGVVDENGEIRILRSYAGDELENLNWRIVVS